MFAAVVITRVIFAIARQSVLQQSAQSIESPGGRVPRYIEWLDLRAQKMVRTTRAKFREARRVMSIDETPNGFVVLNRPDETCALTDLSAQPGKDCCKRRASWAIGE